MQRGCEMPNAITMETLMLDLLDPVSGLDLIEAQGNSSHVLCHAMGLEILRGYDSDVIMQK